MEENVKTSVEKTKGNLYLLTPTIIKHVNLSFSKPVLLWRELAEEIDKLGYELIKKK